MFGDPKSNPFGFKIAPVSNVALELIAGGDKPVDNSLEQTDIFKYPVYSNGETNDGLLCFSRGYRVDKPAITISARGAIGYSSIRGPYFTPVVRLLSIVPDDCVNIVYLKYYIDSQKVTGTGSSQGQLTLPEFKKLQVLVPPIELQEKYAAFVQQSDKSKLIVSDQLRFNIQRA